MSDGYQIERGVADAPFTLKIHRGEGMALMAMNWKSGPPPVDFVGFAIEYREPGGSKFFPLKNRLNFVGNAGSTPSMKRPATYPSLVAAFQKFRWVHFPRNAELPGGFLYRVTRVSTMTPIADRSALRGALRRSAGPRARSGRSSAPSVPRRPLGAARGVKGSAREAQPPSSWMSRPVRRRPGLK